MNIELKSLELINFKGAKERKIDFGKETDIFGDNEKGKTTIFDSFTWLLFGKDSSNRSDFNVKTIDKDGNVIHGLEHQVTGVLVIGGKEVILKRILKENWVKKRGSADSVFSGNVTEYYVNEEPKKESEYKAYINSIIDENVFKLLTNPFHFNVNTKWQDRRTILLELVGDISDADVINSSSDLKKLKDLLGDSTIDSLKAIISSKKKKLKEQLTAIPIRIDEINRNLPILAEGVDFKSLEKDRAEIKGELVVIENKMSSQRRIAEDFIKKQQELSSMKSKLQNMELQIEKDSMKALNDLKLELTTTEHSRDRLDSDNDSINSTINKLINDIQILDDDATKLRLKFAEEVTKTFAEPDRNNFICPTCKQSLPEGDIENQIEIMRNNFESNKQRVVEDIQKDGKSTVDKKLLLISNKTEYEEKVKSNIAKLDEFNGRIAILQSQIEAEEKKDNKVNYDTNEEYASLKTEITAFEKKLIPLNGDSMVSDARNDFESRLNEINEILNSKESLENAQLRIKELKKDERNYAQQVAELEGQEFLTEQFIKTKVEMLEERINDTFKTITFKMFDVQNNGGLSETCQALINGIPFADANNAAKINAGIDIINALGRFYGTTAPIFIDNREAVNRIIETESQVINLIVSLDKTLRVEVLN